jgi:hypothetical protein
MGLSTFTNRRFAENGQAAFPKVHIMLKMRLLNG